MDIIDKLGEIINCITKGKSLKNIEVTTKEYKELESLLYEFLFLYSYPNDNQIYNEEYINKAFKDNVFFERDYVENSNEYNALLNDKDIKNGIEKNVFFVRPDIINDNDRMSVYVRNEIYEKEDGVIKKYITLKENNNQFFINEWQNVAKCLIPFELSESKIQELVSLNDAKQKDENRYLVKATSNIVLRREVDRKFFKEFSTKAILYKKYKDKFVVEAFLNNGVYKIIEGIKEQQLGFSFYDKNGNEIDKESLDYIKILKKLRDALSHDNVYDYELDAGQDNKHYGKIFVLKSKEDSEDKFKCSVVCLSRYLDPLSSLNCYNTDPEVSSFRFVVVPYLKNKISTDNQIVDLQNKIKVVTIKVNQEIVESYFVQFVKEIIDKYVIIQNNAPELVDFLNKHIKFKFPEVDISVSNVDNVELLNHKCLNNRLLRDSNIKSGREQGDYLNNIFTNFYGVDCLSNDWLKDVPFVKRIKLQNKGMLLIAFNLLKLADEIYKDTIKADKHAQALRVYGTEIYLFYCLLVVYNNFVKNSFVEDLDRKLKNPYMKADEISKSLDSRSNEQKVHDMDMTDFKIYRDNDERLKSAPNENKKTSVLKWIKNGLCHDGVYLKSPLERNVENQILVFKSETDAKHPQNHKPIKIVNTVEIECKKLLNFVSKSIFKDYKSENNQMLQIADFNQLVDVATKLLNDN